MDIYKTAIEYLLGLSHISRWPELQSILKSSESNSPRDWRLPVIACEAVGGKHEQAIPAVAAVACLQTSIILIDDMLDDDPRGLYHRIGTGVTANIAVAFQAVGLDAIVRCEIDPVTKLASLSILNRMILTTALGQNMDVQNPGDEEAYWDLVRTKSSPFFGAALQVGALLGGAAPETIAQIERFGHLYGEMIQIHDDLNDTMAVPANSDWTLGRSPLPILYAQTVEHTDRGRFLELCRVMPDPDALSEAQSILIRSGAVSYSVDLLIRKHQAARQILAIMALTHKAGLESILDDVINPVKELISTIGFPQSEIMLQPPALVS
jgi:geranylgeranyl pyrophosphate synthase